MTVSLKSLARATTPGRDWEWYSFQVHPTNVRSRRAPWPYLPLMFRTVPAVQTNWHSNATTSLSELVSARSTTTTLSRLSRVWPQGRILMKWHERKGRRRGTETRNWYGGGGRRRRGGCRDEWGGLRRSWNVKRNGDGRSWRNGWRGWDGKGGEGVGCTFSDDANPRRGGRGVTQPGSWLLVRFPCGCSRSSIDGPASCGLSPLSTSPSPWRCEDVTLLVRLGDIPSSAKITSCVKICESCDVVGGGE